MLDTTAWSHEQHDAARQLFQLYKQQLRPLIRDANLYHVSPRPDGVHWDGTEYWDLSAKKGVVFAFRGSTPDEPQHRFNLSGLDPDKRYQLHFEDASAPDTQLSGKELIASGLTVHLPYPLSSELIFLTESPP
jgi:alpha-galactosidase